MKPVHRFSNPDPNKVPKGFFAFLKWKFTLSKPKWPKSVAIEATDKPPEKILDKKIRVSFVGHVTFLIQTEALNILTDPVWGSIIGHKRISKPGIDFADLPKIDIVLISHNHYDHMDISTLKKLWKRDKSLFIAPLKNDEILKRKIPGINIKTLNWEGSLAIKEHISIHLEPAQHWSARSLFDQNRVLWGTFIIKTNQGSICFIGDTGYDPQLFKKIGLKYNILLSLIPIGAFEPRWFMKDVHVNPEEAMFIYQDLKSKYAIASHFETFQLANDAFKQADMELEQARNKYKITKDLFITPKIGGVYWFND